MSFIYFQTSEFTLRDQTLLAMRMTTLNLLTVSTACSFLYPL